MFRRRMEWWAVLLLLAVILDKQCVDGRANADGLCWTRFMNSRKPRWSGNDEESPSIHKTDNLAICDNPRDVECRAVDGRPASETGDVLTCTKEEGLLCRRQDQPNRKFCQNYKVRYLCECFCWETLRDSRGNFSLPGSSDHTYKKLRCRWSIKTSKKKLILLRFDQVWNSPATSHSMGSRLTVYDGSNSSSSPVLATLKDFSAATWKDVTLVSSGGAMTIKLSTKNRLERKLKFSYTTEKLPVDWYACRFTKGKCGFVIKSGNWNRVRCQAEGANELLTAPSCPSGGILALIKKDVVRHSTHMLYSPLFNKLNDTCLMMRYRYAIPDSNFTVSMWAWNGTKTYVFTSHLSTDWADAIIPVPMDVTFRLILNATVGKSLKWRTGALSVDYIRKTPCFADISSTFQNDKQLSHVRARPPTQRRPGWVRESGRGPIITGEPSHWLAFRFRSNRPLRPHLPLTFRLSKAPALQKCICFQYQTTLANAHITMTRYWLDNIKNRTTEDVWRQPPSSGVRTWKTACFSLPVGSLKSPLYRIIVYPFDGKARQGFFLFANVTMIDCSAASSNCSFNAGLCGWTDQAHSLTHSPPAWRALDSTGYLWSTYYKPGRNVTCHGGSRDLFYATTRRSRYRLQSGSVYELYGEWMLPRDYRCLTFYTASSTATELTVTVTFVDGRQAHTFLRIRQRNQWELQMVPLFVDTEMIFRVSFITCNGCELAVDEVQFSQYPCSTDVDECANSSLNTCGHLCKNAFRDYFCCCSSYYRYQLTPDRHSCLPICRRPCQNGGTCYAPNKCACPKGFIGLTCATECGGRRTDKEGSIVFPRVLGYLNIRCDWSIEAVTGQGVALEVVRFQPLSYDYNVCRHANLTFWDSRKPGEYAVYCRRKINQRPKRFKSTSEILKFSYFRTNWRYGGLGFQINYTIFNNTCIKDCRQLAWYQRCCNGYTITSPGVFRQGSTAGVNVMLYYTPTSTVRVTAQLVGVSGVVSQTRAVLETGIKQSTNVDYMWIPVTVPSDLLPTNYDLNVTAASPQQVLFSEIVKVGVAPKGPTVLVQTDKPVYKPGQTVRMRIVTLDFELKPYTGNVTVEISDGSGTKVQQWLDQSPVTGIVPLSLPLSDEPVAGTWNISVFALYPPQTEKSLVQKSCFQVKEYVLPKFAVTTIVSSYTVTSDTLTPVVVIAKYTYGKPVKGTACLTATAIYSRRLPYYVSKPVPFQLCKEIDGIADFAVLTSQQSGFYVTGSYYSRYLTHVEFNVTVIEKATGTIINDTETSMTSQYKYILSFLPGSARVYKPGLPFTLKLNIMTPDLLPFINATMISVDLYVYQETYPSRRKFNSTTVEAVNGTAELEVFFEGNRFSDAVYAEARTSLPYGGTAAHTVLVSGLINKQQMTTRTREELLPPGPNEFIFYTTHSVESDLFLLASSKGALLRSWSESIRTENSPTYPGLHEFRLWINVSCSLAPQFHLVSYYVGDANTATSDVITLRVQPCFQHKVNISFSSNETRPGEKVQLSVTADPGSMVSLSAVDKSVYLVPSSCGSQITSEKVLAEIAKYDVSSSSSSGDVQFDGSGGGDSDVDGGQRDWWRSWWPSTEYPTSFKSAGLAVRSSFHFGKQTVYRFRRQVAGSGSDGDDSDGGFAGVNRVRSFFPETWLWEDHITGVNGEVVLNLTVPDTITTWVADAFAISKSSAFGIAETPATLLAFQPFFVSLSLPYSVVRGEEMTVVATVFNYYHDNLTVLVTLERQLSEFRFLEGDMNKQNVSLFVQSKDSATARFHIVPLRLGYIPLKVTAYSSLESDAVLRSLLVEPEGVEKRFSESILVANDDSLEFPIEIPDYAVPGSGRLVLSVTGDFLGPAISCLGSLLRMPYGCGEQNMINFAPAVYIKKYLSEIDQLTPAVDSRASLIMRTGYQRELRYQRSDGSYAAFGDYSTRGSLCLTALVMRVYAQAIPHMYIDQTSMSSSLCWLMEKQAADGSLGTAVDVNNPTLYCASRGKDTPSELTAYVVMGLREAQRNLDNEGLQCNFGYVAFDAVINKSATFLLSKSDGLTSPYSQAMVAYALALAGDNTADKLIDKLFLSADRKGGTCFWSLGYQCSYYRCRYLASSIQTASYVILASLERDRLADTICIVSWLAEQMDGCGGYRSTQDTILALFALSEASKRSFAPDKLPNMALHVTIEDHLDTNFDVAPYNYFITQKQEMSISKSIQVQAAGSGHGLILFQTDLTYNIPDIEPEESFMLNASVKIKQPDVTVNFFNLGRDKRSFEANVFDSLGLGEPLEEDLDVDVVDRLIDEEVQRRSRQVQIESNLDELPSPTSPPLPERRPTILVTEVCFQWKRPTEKAGMVIVEVGLLSGFRADTPSLQELVPKPAIGLMRYEAKERRVNFYFEEFPETNSVCFSFDQSRSHCVAKMQPAYVRAYSYYQPEYRTTVKYQPPDSVSNNSLEECDDEFANAVIDIVESGSGAVSGSGGGGEWL